MIILIKFPHVTAPLQQIQPQKRQTRYCLEFCMDFGTFLREQMENYWVWSAFPAQHHVQNIKHSNSLFFFTPDLIPHHQLGENVRTWWYFPKQSPSLQKFLVQGFAEPEVVSRLVFLSEFLFSEACLWTHTQFYHPQHPVVRRFIF